MALKHTPQLESHICDILRDHYRQCTGRVLSDALDDATIWAIHKDNGFDVIETLDALWLMCQ